MGYTGTKHLIEVDFNRDRRDWKRFYFPCFLLELFEFSSICTTFIIRVYTLVFSRSIQNILKIKKKKPKDEKEKKDLIRNVHRTLTSYSQRLLKPLTEVP